MEVNQTLAKPIDSMHEENHLPKGMQGILWINSIDAARVHNNQLSCLGSLSVATGSVVVDDVAIISKLLIDTGSATSVMPMDM